MLHCSCFVTFDALSHPAVLRMVVTGNSPAHWSSPEHRWKQSLLTSPRGTSPLLLLHNLCCFSGYLPLGFLPESRLVGEVANSPLRSGRDMQRCCKCIPSHPDVPSFTVNLAPDDSAAALCPPERGARQEHYSPPKLSSNINPATFTEEAHKSPKSCYSVVTVTF